MAEAGTIIAKSDGDNIEFDKNASSAQKTSSKQNNNKSTENKQSVKANQKTKPDTDVVEEVYITNTGKKYHRADCRHLKSSKIL